jgi:hypothetical protein
MKGFLPRFSREARGIHLDCAEKRAVREALQHFIRENPAKETPALRGPTSDPSILSTQEKASMLKDLRKSIRQHADSTGNPSCPLPLKHVSGGKGLLPFSLTTSSAIACIIVFMFGSGITGAAESSLPGDLLYPVKLHVNERFMMGSTLASGEEATSWEMERTIRRLDEEQPVAGLSCLRDSFVGDSAPQFELNVLECVAGNRSASRSEEIQD